MKHLKILGLAVVAAAALTAFVGVGSASATALCKEGNMTTNTCASNQSYISGTVIKAKTNGTRTAKLVTGLATVICDSEAVGETTSGATAGAAALPGEITALSFTNCIVEGTTQTCTVTTNPPKYNASITWTSSTVGNFVVSTKTGGNNPGASVVCGTVINCEFNKTPITLSAASTEAGLGTITAGGIELAVGVGTKCPKSAKWTATYVVSEPSPVFIEKG